MQTYRLIYSMLGTDNKPVTRTTLFENTATDMAEYSVNVFFRMLLGHHINPACLRKEWDGKNFKGYVRSIEHPDRICVFAGVLMLESEYQESVQSAVEKHTPDKVLEQLKSADLESNTV